jgi:hypothetical protein
LIGDKIALLGRELRFAVAASDVDLPVQALTYSLLSAPVGASIDPGTGTFSWTPTSTGIYSATVALSDSSALSDQASFVITVTDRLVSYGASAAASVAEGSQLAVIITRSGSTDVASHVSYTLGGTATAGADYTAQQAGQVNFAVGQAQATLVLSTTDDRVAEGPESLSLTLADGSDPGGGLVAYDPESITVTIIDDDVAGAALSATALTLKAGEERALGVALSSQPQATVRITLSSSDPTVCAISPASVELNAATWQSGVSVTVAGQSAGTCTITGTITSSDPQYGGIPLTPIMVAVGMPSQRIYLPLLQR